MNFNAIFKNVKIIKIGLLDAKLKENFEKDRDDDHDEDPDEKSFLEPPREFHSGG